MLVKPLQMQNMKGNLCAGVQHQAYFGSIITMELHQRHPHLYASCAQRGLLCIRNLQTNCVLLVMGEDLSSLIKTTRFSLDMGLYPHPGLQQEYETLGLEQFSIEVYQTANEYEDLESLLETCKGQLEREGVRLY